MKLKEIRKLIQEEISKHNKQDECLFVKKENEPIEKAKKVDATPTHQTIIPNTSNEIEIKRPDDETEYEVDDVLVAKITTLILNGESNGK